MKKRMTLGDRAVDIFANIICGFLAFLCLMPVIHTLAISLSRSSVVEANMVYFWPVDFTLASYKEILKDAQFFRSFGISVARVVVGCTWQICLVTLCAFPMAHTSKQFRGRNVIMVILMFCNLFGGGLIPYYMVVNALGLVNTIWVLTCTGFSIGNAILLMNFFRNLPKELEEAAEVDGASPYRILISIFVPLSMPCLATILLFNFVGHWNSYFDGLIYMSHTKNYPLQTYIYTLNSQLTAENMAWLTPDEIARLSEISGKSFSAAKVFVAMIPILCIYPFMQKYFTKGLVVGAVKG
ncbi:MAG: carbohydrate ABC transporter permease [Clostridia bacterium]|nr:carbohydrate ABC transporter permease [Clostridia bacterium]